MRRFAAVLPLGLLVLAGCGDDGPSLEERRSEYLAQAEAVCAESNAGAAALGTPATVQEVPEFADAAVALVRDTVDGLTELTPPEEDRAELEQKVLGPLRADVGTAEQYAEQIKAAAAANDVGTLLELGNSTPTTSADVDFMRSYGFDECVKAAEQGG